MNILSFYHLVQRYWLFLFLFFLIIIGVASLWPRVNLQTGISFHDKIFHLIAYFSLSLPVFISNSKSIKMIVVFIIFYGGLLEVIQPYINRSCDIYDFIANVLGLCFAYYIFLRLKKFLI